MKISMKREMLDALKDIISCSDANDGESLMNAIEAAREIVEKIEEKTS